MKHLVQTFSHQGLPAEKDLNQDLFDDDIEQAFGTLPTIMPPANLVSNIMAAVAQLPRPVLPTTKLPLDDFDLLKVSLETENLC